MHSSSMSGMHLGNVSRCPTACSPALHRQRTRPQHACRCHPSDAAHPHPDIPQPNRSGHDASHPNHRNRASPTLRSQHVHAAAIIAPAAPSPTDVTVGDQTPDAATPTSTVTPRVVSNADAIETYLQNVVKVFSTFSRPNWGLPWQRQRQESATLSGFIIDPANRVLVTSAYYLQYCSRVQVKKTGDDSRYTARILCLAVNTDIALLTVDDAAFWAPPSPPLPPGPLPQLRDKVAVVGYPVGGASISITEGVVSRVEMTNCQHLNEQILGMQIDAAINRGNEGSLVMNNRGQLIGMAAYSLPGDTENIGYVIPTAVVQHVMEDWRRHGELRGHPSLGVEYQMIESEAMRGKLGMVGATQGVLVRRVVPTAPAAEVLRRWDVVVSVDGVPIAGDGTVPFRIGERINWTHLIKQKFPGDQLTLSLLREGAPLTVTIPLNGPSTSAMLIPQHLDDRDPPYVLLGGLLLSVCSGPYLRWEYGADLRGRAPVRLVEQYFYQSKPEEGREVVVLNQVLACNCTSGYESIGKDLQLLSLNGTPLHSLAHLVGLVAACPDPHLVLEFDMGFLLVLNREEALEETEGVMERYGIPRAVSRELRAAVDEAGAVVWPAGWAVGGDS